MKSMACDLLRAGRTLLASARTRFIGSLLLVAGVMAFGTAGYCLIEGWSVFDALYMTVITITTIGFKEVNDLSEAGRVFTVLLIFFSVGAVFYSLNNAAKILIEGELRDLFGRRKLQNEIDKMKDHYVVCGHGRMGRIICEELTSKGAPFVIIDNVLEPELKLQQALMFIEGDATKDETLVAAGIERAKGLITVLPTDAENLYVVLSARGMNRDLNIVARAVEDGADRKLMRAGANRVVSPYHIGAIRIAHTLLKPSVVDFIEVATRSGPIGLQMEEILVEASSSLAGKTLSQAGIGRDLGIIVVAIKAPGQALRVSPAHDTAISAGDKLVVIGQEERLGLLEELAAGRA